MSLLLWDALVGRTDWERQGMPRLRQEQPREPSRCAWL